MSIYVDTFNGGRARAFDIPSGGKQERNNKRIINNKSSRTSSAKKRVDGKESRKTIEPHAFQLCRYVYKVCI